MSTDIEKGQIWEDQLGQQFLVDRIVYDFTINEELIWLKPLYSSQYDLFVYTKPTLFAKTSGGTAMFRRSDV